MTLAKRLSTLIYDACLHRAPTQDEIADIEARLSAGGSQIDILESVLKSDESRAYRKLLYVRPGHFYSPIVHVPSLKLLSCRRPWDSSIAINDVDLDFDAMWTLWQQHLAPLVKATPFSDDGDHIHRYKLNNPNFAGGDGLILRAMILHARPKRIIEVGSGWSSCCILDSVDELGGNVDVTLVEPYPARLQSLLRPGDENRLKMLLQPVQSVALATFEALEAGDILFIDSTHIIKTESDVVHELTEILPRIKPGVLIHFHDVFYPFEYPRAWVFDQNRSWNEVYALRAFLAFNDKFRVVFFNDPFASRFKDKLGHDFPNLVANSGAGIWIRRVA